MTEHRVELVQLVDAPGDLFDGDTELVRQFALLGVIVRQEFMKRWIEKSNCRRQAI